MIEKTAKVWLGGRGGVTAPIHVSQYDTGWRFLLSIYDGDAVYTGGESTVVYMEGRKSDGTVFAVPGAFADGVAVVECTASITAAVGPIDCELRVSEGGETIGTANFEIIVEAAPLKGYVASGDDFSAMQQVLDGANEAAGDAMASKTAAAASAAAAAVSAATAQVQAGMAYKITATAAGMTDTTIGYLYTGNEDGYTFGGWYYWDGSAWTLGGLSVDPTLTVAGAAADAKATGDAIGDVKSAMNNGFTGMEKIMPSATWKLGSLKSASGAETDATNRLRTGYIAINRTCAVSCAPGYKFSIYVFSIANLSGYIGIFNGRSAEKTAAWLTGKTYIGQFDKSYRYRLLIAKADDSDMTVEEGANLVRYAYTDTDFESMGVPADALETGNRFVAVEEKLPNIMYYPTGSSSEETYNGITYSSSSGVASLAGTATGKFFHILQGGSSSIPAWIEAGKEYFVDLTTTGTKNVKFNVTAYKNGASTSLFSSETNGSFVVPAAEDFDGLVTRYYVPKDRTVDATIRPKITDKPTAEYLNKIEVEYSDAPIKIRIMQNNLGRFNRGDPVDDPTNHFLTTDNCDTVLNNYRTLFGDVQPDIIGYEEYESEAVAKGVGGAEDRSVDLNTEIFNRVYPYQSVKHGSVSKTIFKSKLPFADSSVQTLSYSYEYDGETIESTFKVVYAHIQIGGKELALIVNAFPNSNSSYSDERNAAMKKAFYQAVVDFLADDDNAFIICDTNASPAIYGGILDDIMDEILIPAGFNSAMGSYFPYQYTYKSPRTDPPVYKCLDNIFYKGSKVQLVNLKVLMSDWDGLASDHAPVYADFLIL